MREFYLYKKINKYILKNTFKSFFVVVFIFSFLNVSNAQTTSCDPFTKVCTPVQTTPAVSDPNTDCGGKDNFNCYTLLESIGNEDDGVDTIEISSDGLGSYLELIMSYLLIMVTIAAVFYMTYGGILYLTTDIINQKKEGREVITRVIIGLIFVFSIWTIMNSINSGLLRNSLDFSLKKIGIDVKMTPLPSGTGTGTTSSSTPKDPRVISGCASGLETISGSYKLCSSVAGNMKSLISAAAADGVTLGIASAYRSANSGSVTGGTAAANGKSMHQQGLAVDFSGGFKRGPATDKRYVWLRANASKFGFYNNLAPAKADEYNHWSTTGR